PFDVIEIARSNRDKMVVFLAVGFETTASAIASLVKHAEEKSINNINVMTSIRLMPPILEKVLQQHNGRLHGIICPGHVATIMGEEYFEFLPEKYRIASVISGFDAADILGAIYLIVQSKCEGNKPELKNIYRKCVSINGNEKAKDLMKEVFRVDDGLWRGIGSVPDSALVLKEQYAKYDAVKNFNLSSWSDETCNACSCSDILMGKKEPKDCNLFGTICNPVNPYGPCMVSSEGACSIYYEYRR
ncbi:MAG: hydrogenase formation protein HypD, partial [Lutispora sp.]